MLSAVWTLTKAFFRLLFPSVVLMPTLAIVGPWLLSQFITIQVGSPVPMTDGQMESPPWYLNYIVISLFCFAVGPWAVLPDFIRKANLRLLPLSNRQLGTFLWLAPASIIMVSNVVTQIGYRILFGNTWPILTTTLCVGVFSTLWLAGGLRLLDFRWYRIPAFIALILIWSGWFVLRCYPDGLRGPLVPLEAFSAMDLGVLGLTAAGTWWLTVTAFATYRCGETRDQVLFRTLQWMPFETTWADPEPCLPRPASPLAGLRAMEWKKGRSMALATASAMVMLMALGSVTTLTSPDASLMGVILLLLSLCSMISGVILGMWLGAEIGEKSGNAMKQSYSTLPFSDADLGRVMLGTCLKSIVMCWSLICVVLLLIVGLHTVFVERVNPVSLYRDALWIQEFGPLTGVLMVAASLVAAWTVAGLGASLALAGRVWFSSGLIGLAMVLAITYLVLPVVFPGWGQTVAAAIPLTVAVGGGLCGTVGMFRAAHRARLVTWQCTVLCAFAVTILSVGLLVGLNSQPRSASLAAQVIAVCAAFLTIMPVPALPLALAWNRHR